jgi:succinoglycan biosynthesis protein ExoM
MTASTIDSNAQRARMKTSSTSMPRVTICIPTYQRPGNLTDLLVSLRAMDREGIDLHLIVVDNDDARSAEPIVVDAMRDSGIPVLYDMVAERSLPVVRNRLVELASTIDPGWIWFLDDDQFVEPDALQLMIATADTTGADCVVGRVPHSFEGSNSQWAHWSGIFNEVHRPTGQPTGSFGSNGPLVRVEALRHVDGPFDARLGLTGGEDSLFFTRFHDLGFRSVGCDEAVIWDRLHASRNTPRWLTQRALRFGLVKGFLVREVSPSPIKTAKWLAIGAGYMSLNAARTLVALPFGPSRFFRYWIKAARGYGIVVGTLFPKRLLKTQEYAKVHGH